MIKTEKAGKVIIVSFIISKLNAIVAEDVRNEISRLFEEPNSWVIINMSGVEYIDSTGFGSLLSILRSAKNNYGMVKICCAGQRVQDLMETLHLNSVFELHSELDECIKSFH